MMPEELGAYALVFVAAATPWIEILLVIPGGVAAGLQPVVVGLVAFAGNALPVVAVVVAYERFVSWRRRRSRERAPVDAEPGTADGAYGSPACASGPQGRGRGRTRRRERAARIRDRYGIPGLALLGPLTVGIHFATGFAVALGGGRRTVIVWMTASLAAWTVVLTAASALGYGIFTR